MRRPKRRSTFVRLVVFGALILWLGLLLIGILSYQPPADTAPKANDVASKFRAQSTRAGGQPSSRLRERRASDSTTISETAPRRSGARDDTLDSNDAMAQAKRQRPPGAGVGIPSQTDERAQVQSDNARVNTSAGAAVDTSPDSVVRAQFTSGIEGQEPINRISSVFSMDGEVFSLDGRPVSSLYYFTEITGMRGETVTHRWEHDGEVVGETSFNVGADPLRVYSHEDMPASMPGDWRVVVIDAQGNVIKTGRFLYQAF